MEITTEQILDNHIKEWELTPDGDSFQTHSSILQPVLHRNLKAMIKIPLTPDEKAGSKMLDWWDGVGAVKVIRSDNVAILMERIVDNHSLKNTLLWDGATQFFEEKGIPLKIISLPGHTKDSIGLLTLDGLLFCGDAAMNGFPSINRNIIWIENLDDYRKSWQTMLNCGAKMILPSHGKPFPVTDLERFVSSLGRLKIYKP